MEEMPAKFPGWEPLDYLDTHLSPRRDLGFVELTPELRDEVRAQELEAELADPLNEVPRQWRGHGKLCRDSYGCFENRSKRLKGNHH